MISTSVTKIKNNLKLVYEFIAKNLYRRERVSKIKYSTIFRDWLLFIPLVASLRWKKWKRSKKTYWIASLIERTVSPSCLPGTASHCRIKCWVRWGGRWGQTPQNSSCAVNSWPWWGIRWKGFQRFQIYVLYIEVRQSFVVEWIGKTILRGGCLFNQSWFECTPPLFEFHTLKNYLWNTLK